MELQYQKDKLKRNLEHLRERSRENDLLSSVIVDYERYEERLRMKDRKFTEQKTAHEQHLQMLDAYIRDIMETNELTETGLNKITYENNRILSELDRLRTSSLEAEKGEKTEKDETDEAKKTEKDENTEKGKKTEKDETDEAKKTENIEKGEKDENTEKDEAETDEAEETEKGEKTENTEKDETDEAEETGKGEAEKDEETEKDEAETDEAKKTENTENTEKDEAEKPEGQRL